MISGLGQQLKSPGKPMGQDGLPIRSDGRVGLKTGLYARIIAWARFETDRALHHGLELINGFNTKYQQPEYIARILFNLTIQGKNSVSGMGKSARLCDSWTVSFLQDRDKPTVF